jgi:hypothetical protein
MLAARPRWLVAVIHDDDVEKRCVEPSPCALGRPEALSAASSLTVSNDKAALKGGQLAAAGALGDAVDVGASDAISAFDADRS